MSAIILALVKQLAPVVIGPMVTSAVKWLMARFGTKLPALAKVAVSAAAGAVTAATTGNVTDLAAATATMVGGGIAGAAGSKARDVIVGKPEACAPGEFVPPWTDKSNGEG
jgi:hypothetical protein